MVLIILNYQISNAQTIKKYNPGDTLIVGDTAIIGIDVFTYRVIKETGVTTSQLVAQKSLLIAGLENEIEKNQEIISSKDKRISILQDDNIRKDLAITNLVSINRDLSDKTLTGLGTIEEKINETNKPFYTNGKFWSGVGAGIILGVLFVNR